MADFLSEKRQEIDNRLKELRPLYEEYLKLERAQQALAGMDQPRRRGPGRPPAGQRLDHHASRLQRQRPPAPPRARWR